MKSIGLLLCTLLIVACSRQNETPPEASRADFENVLVQNDPKGDTESVRKAAQAELTRQLSELTGRLAKATTLHEAFTLAEAIENLGKSVRADLEAQAPALPELPRIAALRALWVLEGWDPAVNGLLAIVEGTAAMETRVAAAEVLGTLASERHEAVLRKALQEKVFDPPVKVQLAVALWRSARDTAATKVLRDLLESENEAFRIQAALALGEINQITAESRTVLEQLSEEPSLRGRTARRALEYDKAMRRLEAAIEGKTPGQPAPEPIDTRMLNEVQAMIQERYIYPDLVSGRKLIYAAASGMLNGLDPYTCMLEDNQLRDAAEIQRFAVPTLGLSLGSAKLDDKRQLRLTRVLSARPGSPAERAGIQPGDRIYRVARGIDQASLNDLRTGKLELPEESRPFQLLPLDEALTQFNGALGTTVALQVMRDGWLLARWVMLTHELAEYEAVSHEVLPGGIGMIHVVELGAAAPGQVREAMAALRKAEVKAVILDVRGASGGSVEAATQMASQFLPANTLVTYSVGRSEEVAPRREYRTSGEGDTKLPLVVLTNGGTADAAEVLAGALKEHSRARVVGEKTFGRAIVQELIPLRARELAEDSRNMALLLTVARYHGPVSQVQWYDRGVDVDAQFKPPLFDGWVYDQFESALASPAFAAYLDGLAAKMEPDALVALARADKRNVEAWPGIEALHKQLDLKTGLEELRFLLRDELRRRLADKVPSVDLQEDAVFVGAVREAAKAAGINLADIPEYALLRR